MKKSIQLLIALALVTSMAFAKPVTPADAQKVAEGFMKQVAMGKFAVGLTLKYTEISKTGTPLYYVFGFPTTGFIIISADDAAHPIIGYSTTGNYVTPDKNSTIGHWMEIRKKELASIPVLNAQPNNEINREWAGDFTTAASYRQGNQSVAASVAPLCQTTWNQNGGGGVPYNNLCPGGSVTGCVATAMSQIMRFWSYPAMGTGSSSYTAGSYGTLSCNYGATTYNWSNMPLNSSNADVALISYQTGVSVEMNYSPSGSGAYVITGDNPVCAQASFVNYFNYDPNTIQGLYRSSYTDPNWIALLENELTAGRPVQYVGSDPNQGGHTWVCDGFDASNNFHMNWGWGGSDDGFFSINNLLTTNGGFNPSQNHEALIGIQPKVTVAVDAGIPSITSPIGTICGSSISPVVTVKNFGATTLTSCVINYKVDNGTVQTQNWSGSLTNGATATVNLPTQTTTAGTHTLSCYTSSPNGTTDGNPANDLWTANFSTNPSGLALPLAEGFESSAALPAGWTLYNPDADAAWQVVTTVAHTGTNCIGFNNCNGDGATDMTGRKDKFITTTYNFSNASSATLSFDVAYAVLTYSGTTYNDALNVYASTDCGVTWNSIYAKSGATLASAPGYTSIASCWTPTSSSWRTDVVNLSSVIGHSNVMFAWENVSAWGTWIYVDNINISSMTTGIATHNNNGFNLYPNPASGSFTIESGHSGKITYAVYSMSGQEVKNGSVNNKETISTSDMAGGIYFVKVIDGGNTYIKKLVVSQ
ncbi:MAG TPA: C10 family peptidase [Bacteroidia bacterium]|jgi:hypothetical protein|nr:C10 family peptidase [Bacteroidia bacterium]